MTAAERDPAYGRLDRILAAAKVAHEPGGDPDLQASPLNDCWIGDGCQGQHLLAQHTAIEQALDLGGRAEGEVVDAFVAAATTPLIRLQGMVAALEAECAELAKLTATCTCQTWPPDGPEPGCPVHGAIRAFNDATREIAALVDALGDPALTHDFVTPGPVPDADMCGEPVIGSTHSPRTPRMLPCCEPLAHPVHRTPAVVRAELEAGR